MDKRLREKEITETAKYCKAEYTLRMHTYK